MNFDTYDPEVFYDEFFMEPGKPRPEVEKLVNRINSFGKSDLATRRRSANAAFKQMGITFGVYGDNKGLEKIFPFDIIPRIINAHDWNLIERGVKQRVYALNLFIHDIYNDQKILKDGIIQKEFILSSVAYRKECEGLTPPKNIWCHVSGIDLVRDHDGQFYVLEDNLRCPSGVSYVLGNRRVMKQTWPAVFEALPIRPVEDYAGRLAETLRYLIPESILKPNIGILTPGIHNSAYFEHSFLAQQMGEELVEGQDLVVMDNVVYMRTTKGFERIHAVYRRIDDDFLDPTVFNPDSLLGVPGIMKSYREGKVAMANAPGAGIADDKAIYAFVPEIIKYYTGEDAILPNVPTYVCEDEKQRQHVIDNIENFVVKTAHGSGGYGMLIGPFSTKKEQKDMINNILREPRNYIGQPVIQLSRVPIMVKDRFEGRHVDLRPYVLYGQDIYVLPGGLTRVALKKDSLVVNSSQGGGSKDTWVLEEDVIKTDRPSDV
ncbi:MAG: circularly permuted type 2 ATP-grasp protein [Nitrospinota bacterium]|nr:circularly permuted type 2 ATP-grasp protein [Nitrospinota bacterium]